MRNRLWLEQCELCGKSFDAELWARDHGRRLCTLCQYEWDDLRIESVTETMPKAEDWPEVMWPLRNMWPLRKMTEDEVQCRWFEDDHLGTLEEGY